MEKKINRGSDSKVEEKEGKLVNVIGKRIPSIRKERKKKKKI